VGKAEPLVEAGDGSTIKKIIFFQSFFIGVFELIWGKFVILQNFSPYGFIYPSELQR
jgi:hypothetical protein